MSARLDAGLAFSQRLRAGTRTPMGWCANPAPLNAAALARGGFPAVCIELQHGYNDEASLMTAIQAVHQAGASPGLRIPVGRFDLASRALDTGAQFVIAPMINTVDDAKALVEATKYPPVGGRSWGPNLALDMWGTDGPSYLAAANDLVITLAMIETVEARDNLHAILAVPGIDGVFVGPSDLSITLSQGARLEPMADAIIDATVAIGAQAREAGKIPAVYAFDAQKAKAYLDRGFVLSAVGSDIAALKGYAKDALSVI